mgnify:CR=1 FL=1
MAAYTTIDNPELYFQTKLYTGNAGTNAITFDGSENMQPDWIWGKDRSGDRHFLADSVRGKKNTGYHLLCTNNNQGDGSNAPPDGITAIGTDGFTLGANTSNTDGGWSYEINESPDSGQGNSGTYAAWCWKAGTTSGISGSPSITPAGYSFNATAGFSIITWTGTGANATLPHGLGVAPAVIIIKNRDGGHWRVYHHRNTSAPETDFLELSDTDATSDDNTAFNDTAPTSTLFSVGSMDETNKNTEGMIAYCFAEKQGYFKAGSYTGNGNVDGPYVHLGFRPAFIIAKKSDGTSHWLMMDNKRDPFNVADALVVANDSDSESNWGTDRKIDFLSNGFKCRSTSTEINNDDAKHVYMAFAESPFVNSNSVPNNAR